MQPIAPNKHLSGFTLVEMMVIAPIIILAIGGFVALIVTLTGNVLSSNATNTMVYDTQNALDIIEKDARFSAQFLKTTGPLPSPQGSNLNFAGTTAFSSSNTLILAVPAQTSNPFQLNRSLVYSANQPNPCGPEQSANRPFLIQSVYFLKDGSLWRRTIIPDSPRCQVVWQVNSCSPGYSASLCEAIDQELIKNVTAFEVHYFADPTSTTDLGADHAQEASTIKVTVTSKKTVAGKDVSASQSVTVTKLNSDTPSSAAATPPTPVLLDAYDDVYLYLGIDAPTPNDIFRVSVHCLAGGAVTTFMTNNPPTSELNTYYESSGTVYFFSMNRTVVRSAVGCHFSEANVTIERYVDGKYSQPLTVVPSDYDS